MQDDLDASEDERIIELSSIEAIFPELKIDPTDPCIASLDIPVNPETPLKIAFQASAQNVPLSIKSHTLTHSAEPRLPNDFSAAPIEVHELSHLPDLVIKVSLPLGYPSNKPPEVQLSSTPQWLPDTTLKALTDDSERLWHEIGKDQMVYSYIDHLQQSAEAAFGIGAEANGQFELPGDLKIALLDYDLRKRREQFEKGTYECGICLEPKKGILCHRLLLCAHVFCVACLQDFYKTAISEGDIDAVKCLAPDCGKTDVINSPENKRRKFDRTLNPSELLQIPLTEEQVQRYVKLKRKKKLEADKDTIYCPRQWCQGAARSKKHPKSDNPLGDFDDSDLESDEETENTTTQKKKTFGSIPMSERLAVCEDCDFAFCSVCKKGWHGELAWCDPIRDAEMNEEEKATMAYLEKYSTPCPTCKAPAQKTMGCNHMICFQCKTHFCYLCSAYLMPENPYGHFNDPDGGCFLKLWELEAGDGEGAGRAFNGPVGAGVPWDPADFESEEESESESDDEDLVEVLNGRVEPPENDLADTDDEEPAPDQRRPERNMHIEIVNFARNGANQRIQLPDQPRRELPPPPPPAPNPPRHRGQRQAVRGRVMNHGGNGNVNGAINPRNGAANHRNGGANHHAAAPGQNRAPIRINGLDRFLQLALNDQEDEWDSDELDDDEF